MSASSNTVGSCRSGSVRHVKAVPGCSGLLTSGIVCRELGGRTVSCKSMKHSTVIHSNFIPAATDLTFAPAEGTRPAAIQPLLNSARADELELEQQCRERDRCDVESSSARSFDLKSACTTATFTKWPSPPRIRLWQSHSSTLRSRLDDDTDAPFDSLLALGSPHHRRSHESEYLCNINSAATSLYAARSSQRHARLRWTGSR